MIAAKVYNNKPIAKEINRSKHTTSLINLDLGLLIIGKKNK